jgi:membrane protein implicated in regulation of membrane protease activity
VLFNAVVRRRIRARPPGLEPELVGESGIALAAIAPGAQGSVEVRGTTWQARNVGPEALAPRAPVLVTAVRGIMLDVRG